MSGARPSVPDHAGLARAWWARVRIRFSHCDPAGIVYFRRSFDLLNGVVEDGFDGALEHDAFAWSPSKDMNVIDFNMKEHEVEKSARVFGGHHPPAVLISGILAVMAGLVPAIHAQPRDAVARYRDTAPAEDFA